MCIASFFETFQVPEERRTIDYLMRCSTFDFGIDIKEVTDIREVFGVCLVRHISCVNNIVEELSKLDSLLKDLASVTTLNIKYKREDGYSDLPLHTWVLREDEEVDVYIKAIEGEGYERRLLIVFRNWIAGTQALMCNHVFSPRCAGRRLINQDVRPDFIRSNYSVLDSFETVARDISFLLATCFPIPGRFKKSARSARLSRRPIPALDNFIKTTRGNTNKK